MELRHLRYFVAVAEELHFGRAAERVGIAQPPLSQQIQKLEREMGVRLFVRTKRRVELTHPGQVFLAEARRTLAQAEHAVEAARRAERGEVGRLAVGFVGSSTYTVLPPVLRAFRRQHPGVELTLRELTTAQQLEAVRRGEIDVGFVRTPAPDGQLAQRVLIEEEFVVALPRSHPSARRRRVALRDLRGDAFILYPRALAAGLYDRVVSACQQSGFSPRVIQETTQVPVMVSLVASGLGVAVVPACVQALRWNNVVYRLLCEPKPRTNIALVWRRNSEAESAPLRHFLQHTGR